MKKITLVLSTLIILLLSGCGLYVSSDVTVFHTLPIKKEVVRYAFLTNSLQSNSLEYLTYQRFISKELSKHNYVLSPQSEASLLVEFNYSIDDGRTVMYSVPTFGQTGVSSSTTYGTLNSYGNYGTYSSRTTYMPTYGMTGSQTVSMELYTRRLQLKILNKSTMKPIYEGSAANQGRSNQMNVVMPYLVGSLFKDFPGKSSSTTQVKIMYPIKGY